MIFFRNRNDKLTSVTYLGEIARLIILKCLSDNIILKGHVSEIIQNKNAIGLELMAKIES